MDNREAKLILSGFRPEGQDANNPAFNQALQQARIDPELARWLAEERSFDQVLSRKLKEMPVPPDLKPSILAGAKTVELERPQALARWLTLAAGLILLLAAPVGWNQWQQRQQMSLFHKEILQFIAQPKLEFQSAKLEQIQEWFAQNQFPVSCEVPGKLQTCSPMGCQNLYWRGKKVGLICFQTDDKRVVHLVLIRRSDLPNLPLPSEPRVAQRGQWAVAYWTGGETAYLLASLGDGQHLKQYL